MKRTTVLNFRTCLEKTSQINGIGFYVNTKIRRFRVSPVMTTSIPLLINSGFPVWCLPHDTVDFESAVLRPLRSPSGFHLGNLSALTLIKYRISTCLSIADFSSDRHSTPAARVGHPGWGHANMPPTLPLDDLDILPLSAAEAEIEEDATNHPVQTHGNPYPLQA